MTSDFQIELAAGGQTSGPMPANIQRVVVILIKPTHYDSEGFPYRFLRGVLPSNSLAAMHALTGDALTHILPANVDCEVHMLEDGIARHAKQLRRLSRRFPEDGTLLIVGLVAVQTAQFPRACDLISFWQSRGAHCVIGGFHVSGSISTMHDGVDDPKRPTIPCPGAMPAEIQALQDRGVSVFHGEAESVWPQALADIIAGQARSLYRGGRPPLSAAPLPDYPASYFKGSFATKMATFDTGRGCPFTCSFCTIINVQGRKSRYRRPAAIVAKVKEICERDGKAAFFFTDDNFVRNPLWEEILDGLIALRRAGHRISFMVEADLACGNIKGFLPKLAEAGCSQIFMGVESMNPRNLKDASKHQNQIQNYATLCEKCHQHGIAVHAGYIIGFPHDTPESVQDDVEQLVSVGIDQVSFFMLTPLPGSEDHIRMHVRGVPMDADLNSYDSFSPVMDHELMSRESWFESFWKAWRQFYRVSNMITALKRCNDRKGRWNLISNYVWYRWSFATEHTHPMISGFYRLRTYAERRAGSAPLSYRCYVAQEAWRHLRYIGRAFAEFYRFQHVAFETELAPLLSEQQQQLADRLHGVGDWLRRTFGKTVTRQWLNRFWIDYGRNRWHLLNPLRAQWHIKMLPHAATEVVYTLRFAWMLRHLFKATAK